MSLRQLVAGFASLGVASLVAQVSGVAVAATLLRVARVGELRPAFARDAMEGA